MDSLSRLYKYTSDKDGLLINFYVYQVVFTNTIVNYISHC